MLTSARTSGAFQVVASTRSWVVVEHKESMQVLCRSWWTVR
jgi:hypothetical protein